MQRHAVTAFRGSDRLQAAWFQGLFHSSVRGAFHLSLTVLCAIGLSVVFSLAGWSRCFGRDSSCPALLRNRPDASSLRVRGFHPLRPAVPGCPLAPPRPPGRPYNPGTRLMTPPVWAVLLSIASTRGIVVTFFSCGYLDVSVPRVRLRAPRGWRIAPAGLPHSDIRGSTGICPSPRLFAACHVLPRLRGSRHPRAPFRLRCALPESGIVLPHSGAHPRLGHLVPTLVRSLCRLPDGKAHPRSRPRDLRFASTCQCPSFVASRTNPGRPAGSVFRWSMAELNCRPLTLSV